MTSQKPSDLLDLARDIPTTQEDARFLRENRPRSVSSTFDEIQKLVDQIPNVQEILRRRPTLEGFEPFELVPFRTDTVEAAPSLRDLPIEIAEDFDDPLPELWEALAE